MAEVIINERFLPPWCVWDHMKKCPEKKMICSSEERLVCSHFNNIGGNHILNLNNPEGLYYDWARINKNPLVTDHHTGDPAFLQRMDEMEERPEAP